MRLLAFIALLAIVVLILWALRATARSRARDPAASDRYRVLETTSGAEAHVLIGRGTQGTSVLIGSVPIASDDFDDRYARLVVQAEDRVATLNASRELHAEP